MQRYIAIVGPSAPADPEVLALAEELGRLMGARGRVVVTGGLGGVMAAAVRGAHEAAGTTLALLPGHDRADAAPGNTVVVPTGLGEMRNALVVRTADVVVAVGGSWGRCPRWPSRCGPACPSCPCVAGTSTRSPAPASASGVVACATAEEAARIDEVLT